jgi:hypothetical protein
MPTFLTRLALATLACCSLAAHANTETIETRPSTKPGYSHAYRFTLQDPQHPGKPYKGRFYAGIAGDGLRIEGKDHYIGHTNGSGKTPSLHTLQTTPAQQWQVVPMVGQGHNGQTFNFVSPDGGALAGMSYALVSVSGPVYCGFSDAQGHTVRYTSPKPEDVRVFALHSSKLSDCHRFAGQVAQAMRAKPGDVRLKALRAFEKQHAGGSYAEPLAEKIKYTLVSEGSLASLQAHLQQTLAQAESDEDRATALNDLAYDLIDQTPPRHLVQARTWLEQSLALEKDNPFTLDSYAWALHLQGEHAKALEIEDRSLAEFGKQCKADELSTRQIGVAHRGHMLWSLGRRDEALKAWALASRAGNDGSWATGLSREFVHVVERLAEGTERTDLCQFAPAAPQ